MANKLIILITVIFSLLIGGFLGYMLGTKTKRESIVETPTLLPETPLLMKVKEIENSKVVSNFTLTVEGEVIEISKESLTLTKDGDSLTFKIKEDTGVSKIDLSTPEKRVPTKVSLEEIQKGDLVTVYTSLERDGELIAREITLIEGRK